MSDPSRSSSDATGILLRYERYEQTEPENFDGIHRSQIVGIHVGGHERNGESEDRQGG